MAEQFPALNEKHQAFIQRQQLYFVATAGMEGKVNLSPKGMESFRIIDEKSVVWLNLTGSGNETAAHVLENQRMTVMFCSFEKQPLILRLYGKAKVAYPRNSRWQALIDLFPDFTGARQLFELKLDMVQTSCGFAVPFYEFQGERPTLKNWADNIGREGTEKYWKEKNGHSLDGKNTGIFESL